MVGGQRRCQAIAEGGRPCQATPLRDGPHCFWHAPETQAEAAEARRLGGLRRRREGAIAGAYEFAGLATPVQIQRVLEIAITDTLALDNSVARNRTLGILAQIALRALEVGELADRLEAVEAAVLPRAARR